MAIQNLRRGLRRLPRRTTLVPSVIGAVMVVLVVTAWALTPTAETEGYVTETRNDLANFAARLESHITTRLAIGKQLRDGLVEGKIAGREEFLEQTAHIHDLFTDFQAINWIDSKGVIRWVSPIKGNEAAQNLNVHTIPPADLAITEAAKTGRLQVTPPIQLAQGGGGFVAYIPIIKMERVTGFINIVFRTEPLMQAAMPESLMNKHDVVLMDKDRRIYGTIDTMAGHDRVLSKWIVVGNRVWSINLLPKPETIGAYSTAVDEVVLLTLLLLCIVIAWLIHLAMVRQVKVKAGDKLFRTFIEHTPSAIIIKDADGNYIHGNSRWHELFNPDHNDIEGRTAADFFPRAYSKEVRDQERRTLETKEMTEYEYLSPVAGGGIMPTLGHMFPITDDHGTVTAIGCTLTDISSNKKTEKALRDALLKAEEANQSKSKFLATMSHELRTPLNAIIGFSDILTGQYFGPVGNQKYIEYAEDINHSGRHLLALIDEVLDISAIELGKREMVLEPVILLDLLSSCVKSVRHRAESQGITLTLVADANLPVIFADETAIRQIFLNLLTNAVKFSHSGDTITLSTEADDDKVVIVVADTGDGIRKEQLPKITDPFVKGHSNSHITHEGAGLGLSIVQSFVAAHEGTLNIESEFGQGTRVTVSLPRTLNRQVA